MRRLLIFLTITVIFITVVNFETSECEGEEKTYKITIFFEGLDNNSFSDDSIQVFYKDGSEDAHKIDGKCKYNEEKHMFEISVSTKECEQFSVENCYLCFDNIEGYIVDYVHFPRFIGNESIELEGGSKRGYKLIDPDKLASDEAFSYGEENTVQMKQLECTVKGKIFTKNSKSSEPIYFSGVKVFLCEKGNGKEVGSGISNNGKYSIICRAVGEYDVVCSLGGYEDYKKGITFDKQRKDVEVNVELETDNAFFDIPHLLMVIGGIIAVIILMIAIIHRAFILKTYSRTKSPFKR